MNTWLRAVMSAIVVVTLAAVVYWANLPTYQVVAQGHGPPLAIWNDDQLVVFVPTRTIGRSLTAFNRTRDAASRLLGTAGLPWNLSLYQIDIVRYERGAVSHMLVDRPETSGSFGLRSRFSAGRLYVAGGVWTGRTLVPVSIEEQRRVHAAPGSKDLGPWNVADALGIRDVPVRLSGETIVLRTRRLGSGGVELELLRPQQPPLHLWTLRPGVERTVSAEEYRRFR